MSSMPLPGGKPPRPPTFSILFSLSVFLSLSKNFQNQNNLAYWAPEKSRLGKVEEVGSFDNFDHVLLTFCPLGSNARAHELYFLGLCSSKNNNRPLKGFHLFEHQETDHLKRLAPKQMINMN